MNATFDPVPTERWGYTHWSLLAYAANCFDGRLDRGRLRCNENRYPLRVDVRRTKLWKEVWSTRMKAPADRLIGHDDWDCLHDFEAAGLLEIVSTFDAMIRLTTHGNVQVIKLHEHKILTGSYATFEV